MSDYYTLFTKALIFATEKHSGQLRKDGRPYIYHPIGVAQLTHMAGKGLKYQIAALLHDVLEDTDASIADIREYGQDIYDAVRCLTRIKGESSDEYMARVLSNKIATVVKSCDVINNMYDTLLCDDVEWVRSYVRKSGLMYKGKLCRATDMAIDMAVRYMDIEPENRVVPSYSKEDMTPYINF